MATTVLWKDGDVILVLGNGKETQERFLTSSALLAHASPVFRAMFAGGHFTEGQNLSANAPKQIDLEEEEPEAFEWLLNVVHLRSKLIPETLNTSDLLAFATVVDKYNCFLAVSYIFEGWWKQVRHKSTHEELSNLIASAYLLRRQKDFRRLSKSLVEKYFNIAGSYEDDLGVLPQPTMLYLRRQYARTRERLLKGISELRELEDNDRCSQDYFQGRCKKFEEASLRKIDTDCVLSAWSALYSESGATWTRSSSTCVCGAKTKDEAPFDEFTQKKIREICHSFSDPCKGLCLKCLRSGREKPDECQEHDRETDDLCQQMEAL